MERSDSGAKYRGDGYHGSSSNLWQQGGRQVVASTSSSSMVAPRSGKDGFLFKAEENNMSASTYSLNKLHPDRAHDFSRSSGSTHSIPLYLMPRPNSVAGKM